MTATDPALRVAVDGHTLGRQATGNETYVRGLVGALQARHDVLPTLLLDADTRVPPGLDGVRTARLRFRHPIPRLLVELSRSGRRWGADLLHVQYVRPPTSDVPVVTTIHDISFERYPRFFRRRTLARLRVTVPWAARHSAAVVTSSHFSRSDLVERYGVQPDTVFVTHLAAEPHFRHVPPEASEAVMAELGVPSGSILCVGNLQPRKNIPRLFEAYHLLLARGADVPDLVVVGRRAWLEHEVFRTVERRSLTERVHFTGFVPDEALPALYSSAAAFVYPSLFEGFGLPILEAFACGTPTITSDAASMPEVAGNAAILVDPLSVEDIAVAIERVVGDTTLRDELVARGYERARQFSWDRTAAGTADAYRFALAAGRR